MTLQNEHSCQLLWALKMAKVDSKAYFKLYRQINKNKQ